jgi:SAM-dependent methyltransferase
MQLQVEDLIGKRLLDAGCGNGTLSAALTDLGLHVVGLDLNDGLGRAYRNRSKYGALANANVTYVQGNLVEPPFKAGSYDLVYSSGVIHHTPSSKNSFASLAPMVRRGGRLYVWVYRKRAWPVRLFFAAGRSLKRIVSLRTLMTICGAIAPAYKVGADLLHGLKVAPFRKRTSREITLDLFDAFAPQFNHWHTEAEMRSWFEEYGFQNINVSGVQKHGIGMYGDMP